MKILHVPFTFAPDPVGGTEIYVESLIRAFKARGVDSIVAAPSGSGADESYNHRGVKVRRFRSAPTSKRMLRELYGEGDPEAASAFATILDEERPDAIHLHAFTRAVSLLLVMEAKRRHLPIFFTYHTPTASCQRGTLMLHGEKICDGLLDIQRCAICSLQANGLPLAAAKIATRTPAWFNRTLERGNRSGGIWTALRMRELIRLRHEAFRQLMREADGIVAVADWVRTLLLRNGVPEEKITLSRHGLASFASAACIDPRLKPLRVAFLARADKIKGAETLIKAVRAAPDLDLEVHLYVLAQSAGDAKHLATLKSLAGDDTRIALRPPVPHHQVIGMLGTYHLVAVPSRWLETGPLVVLEAFAAGTPVIGSRLGGIAELVRHEENGLLIDSMDISEWTAALRVCAQDRNLLIKLRKGVTRPKSMAQVARDMLGMYEARRANSADSRFVGAGI